MILSTHLVDDVARAMSATGDPGAGAHPASRVSSQAMVAQLRGKLWTTLASRAEAEQIRKQHAVLSCRLRSGQMEVRAIASDQPPGMAAATPDLEDVYFATLHQHGLTANLE